MFKNPFVIYMLAFGGVLCVYQLGWSEVYPVMSGDMLAFFGFTFVCAIGLAIAVHSLIHNTQAYTPGALPPWSALILLACFTVDIGYTGSVPLIDLLWGDFTYGGFIGVPSLHLFAATFGSTFCAIRFADAVYSTRWMDRLRYGAEALLPILYFALVVYRGPAMICMATWGFILVIRIGRVGWITSAIGIVVICATLYGYGLAGDLRSGSAAAIEALGRPTEAFKKSRIPPAYFWTFLYSTAPMANFQFAVSRSETISAPDPYNDYRRIPEFIVAEMLPDFISNRALPLFPQEISRTDGKIGRLATDEISPGLNVATVFTRSYRYFGWLGPLVMFAWLCFLSSIYLMLIARSPYRVPCLALLNTMILFCTFDNMIAYSAISLQLVWPVLLQAWPAGFVASRPLTTSP